MSKLRIAHLSDTQIRNFKRHEEFRKSYDNLYASLRQKKPDVIVVVGDIAHTKTQISPEFVRMCSDYFRNLSDIAPLHIIPGNHDGNLNNLSRLDALTPIIENINRSNIFYHKYSTIFKFRAGYNFVVFSCFEDEDKWPKKQDINRDEVNIGLFHGMVADAILQNGEPVSDCPYRLRDFFEIVDYLMLGDIHEKQILDMTYRAAYCGSYPQQNFGESVNKGYLIWDIPEKKDSEKKDSEKHEVDFVELPNVRPFYTMHLPQDLKVPEDLDFQKGARIRVFSRQLNVLEKRALGMAIDKRYEPVETIFVDDVNANRQKVRITSAEMATIDNVSDATVQERLIREHLSSLNLSSDVLQKVFYLNQKYNAMARNEDEVLRNVKYTIGEMKFSNLFSYGEENVFDFSKYKGIVGVFGLNGTGKSSLVVDVPLYCMFNKISKKGVVRNDLMINENKDRCMAQVQISFDNDTHLITRQTTTKEKSDGTVQGKTDVDFRVFQDGTEVEKNGEDRNTTDGEIRKIFGTAEDFMATAMAPQWQLLGIIDAGGTERQKLIGRYFDIEIFDSKHKLAKDDCRTIKNQLKLFEDKDFAALIEHCEKQIKVLRKAIKIKTAEKDALEGKIDECDKKIADVQRAVIPLRAVSSADEKKMDKKIREILLELESLAAEKQRRERCISEIKNFDIKSLRNVYAKWLRVGDLRERAESLEKDCQCNHDAGCLHFNKVLTLKKETQEIEDSLKMSKEDTEKAIGEWERLNRVVSSPDPGVTTGTLSEMLAVYQKEKDAFAKNREQIGKNVVLEKELGELRAEKQTLALQKEKCVLAISQYSLELGSRSATLKNCIEEKELFDRLHGDYQIYDYFTSAMSKDGIVKRIIADNLGIINAEIAKILTQVVGFSMELESTDDGKAIEIYFKHERSKKRRIELCSGMEKTLCAIALRAALVSVTTLPKSNIFVLDEVFTALDPEYMSAVTKMLEHLKQLFETVIIITHIDAFKDVVDHVVEIERNDQGYAKVGN